MFRWRAFVVAATLRELRERYARSALGWLWLLLPPLLFIAIYTLVFSQLARGGFGSDYGPFGYSVYLCAGLLSWLWFSELLSRVASLFTRNAALLKKTPVPWLAVLAIDVMVPVCGLAIQMALFAALLLLLGFWPGWPALWYLPLLLLQALLAVGLGLGLGVLQVFVRDVGLAVPLLLQVWFWLTPIVYSLAIVPAGIQRWLLLNPITPLVQAYQSVVLPGLSAIDWPRLGVLFVIAALAMVGSLALVRRNLAFIYDEI